MVLPINYAIGGANPLDRVQQGVDRGLALQDRERNIANEAADRERALVEQQQADVAFGQANALFDQQFNQRDILFQQGQEDRESQRAAAAAEVERATRMRDDLLTLSENPSAEGYAGLIATYPEMASEFKQAWDVLDAEEQASNLRLMGETYASIDRAIDTGDTSTAISGLEGRIAALRNTPGREDEAEQYSAYLELLKTDPESARASLGVAMAVVGEDGQFDRVLGTGRAVQSTKSFGNGTIIKVFRDGSREVTDPSGKVVEGEDAARVVSEANDFETQVQTDRAGGRRAGTLESDIELGGEAAASELAAVESIKLGQEMFENRANVEKGIVTMQRAIDAIDEGAQTGVVWNILPNITQESAELSSALNNMGLDVVSATTFGALSEGELRLAMSTAAGRDMPPEELRQWLVDRQAAQEKVSAMLLDAASFLSRPGNTLSMWIDRNNAAGQPEQQSAPQAPVGDPNAEFEAMFGGN